MPPYLIYLVHCFRHYILLVFWILYLFTFKPVFASAAVFVIAFNFLRPVSRHHVFSTIYSFSTEFYSYESLCRHATVFLILYVFISTQYPHLLISTLSSSARNTRDAISRCITVIVFYHPLSPVYLLFSIPPSVTLIGGLHIIWILQILILQ